MDDGWKTLPLKQSSQQERCWWHNETGWVFSKSVSVHFKSIEGPETTDSSMCNPLKSICKAKLAGSIHTLMSRLCAKWSGENQNPLSARGGCAEALPRWWEEEINLSGSSRSLHVWRRLSQLRGISLLPFAGRGEGRMSPEVRCHRIKAGLKSERGQR